METFTLVIICEDKPERKHLVTEVTIDMIKTVQTLGLKVLGANIIREQSIEQFNTNPLNRT